MSGWASGVVEAISWLRARPPGDRARIVVAAGLLVGVSLAVEIVQFARLRAALVSAGRRSERIVPGAPTAERVANTVDLVDQGLPSERTCLVRSLTAETLLRAYGHTPRHRIGVDRDAAGGIEAHSWLEDGDQILIGTVDDLSRYEPLPPLNDHGDT